GLVLRPDRLGHRRPSDAAELPPEVMRMRSGRRLLTATFSSVSILVLAVAIPGLALARPLFPNPVFDAGNLPSEVHLADVNGDGIVDQIVTDYGQEQGGPHGLS